MKLPQVPNHILEIAYKIEMIRKENQKTHLPIADNLITESLQRKMKVQSANHLQQMRRV